MPDYYPIIPPFERLRAEELEPEQARVRSIEDIEPTPVDYAAVAAIQIRPIDDIERQIKRIFKKAKSTSNWEIARCCEVAEAQTENNLEQMRRLIHMFKFEGDEEAAACVEHKFGGLMMVLESIRQMREEAASWTWQNEEEREGEGALLEVPEMMEDMDIEDHDSDYDEIKGCGSDDDDDDSDSDSECSCPHCGHEDSEVESDQQVCEGCEVCKDGEIESVHEESECKCDADHDCDEDPECKCECDQEDSEVQSDHEDSKVADMEHE